MFSKKRKFCDLSASDLQLKLQAALTSAVTTCAIGASNKHQDFERSNGWSRFPDFRYHTKGDYINHHSPFASDEEKSNQFDAWLIRWHFKKYRDKSNWQYHCDDSELLSTKAESFKY